ncbi:LysR family transcriptional regulator [Thalassobius sp. MITS945101]|uniref:LysR family transcriptional regulator n=1 Tax=Thalassobius sp. MITS945101 TaxID=3096994 RepID=UPI003999949D
MPYIESLRVFARVVELGSITSGGRDLRLTPAVASKRIKELEARLGVRLFNRTTRSIIPTEVGQMFYEQAKKVLDSLDEAEAVVANFSDTPRGVIRVTAPLGVGRRIIAPLVPEFVKAYPETEVQMRLSDRAIDMMSERLDVAFFVGTPKDSNLKLRRISEVERVLVAAPSYISEHGVPESPQDLLKNHNCLLLRYPRSPEYFWQLQTKNGLRKLEVSGKFDADDSDVLTEWALAGHGIANKPRFDIVRHLQNGDLVEVMTDTPPSASIFGCLYPHRKFQDPKIRAFVDFMTEMGQKAVSDT